MGKHNRLNIRKMHPALWRSITVLGLMGIFLAANFWGSNPTFNPYGWDKNLIGAVFFLIGVSQLIFLNVFRNLMMVRILLIGSIVFMCFWGVSNMQQFIAGNASLQLPILYLTISGLVVPLALEAPVNATTKRVEE